MARYVGIAWTRQLWYSGLKLLAMGDGDGDGWRIDLGSTVPVASDKFDIDCARGSAGRLSTGAGEVEG